jgi:hypothetical protein
MAFILALARASLWVNEHYLEGLQVHWLLWLLGLAIPALTLGSWYGGKIFGLNLLLTCRYLNMNHNDAFSAMKLNSHRHFLRIRIVGDTLTLYPIKLETVPTRNQWRQNLDQSENPSVFIAEPKMTPEFVEAPITIRAARAPSTTEIKKPHELPPDG